MGQNFIGCDRAQTFLMPPDVREWLPEGHLAWFVLDSVAQMDLAAFYGAYRQDGHGRAAFDPAMMVALLLYAYARGQRSSRGIERWCEEDVACRVIAANQGPDHTTIARFRQRPQDALAGLFGEVLGLCAQAGLVDVGVIAVDGTKVHANASERATCDYEQIAREILAEADAVDREEDERFGERRGDELPEQLATGAGRAQWLAEAKRRLERQRAQEARPIPASRRQRLRESKRRLDEELESECRANAAYEAYRARGLMRNGRRLGAHSPPKPYTPPATPQGKINTTDPDSRNVKTPRGWVQGYNAQAAPNARKRKGTRPGWDGGLYAFMRRVLATPAGAALYRKRSAMIEPVFADTKFNRKIDRFQRRGRAACRSEWRLITATHNLLKLWRANPARCAA